MARGKWIEDLHADTAVADAARRVLTTRLEVVREYLPLAVREPDRDIEHVHQLRVGTRRARAALDIFALCLPRKVSKKAKRQLRDLRRAAGEARDWDVFLVNLAPWEKQRIPKHRPGLDFLLGYATARRQIAQTHLEQAGEQYPFEFDRFLAETVAAVRPPDGDRIRTLLDLARPHLAGLIKELDEAAARNLEDYEHLHQVRIIGKRLRYAMEIFASCFAPSFREQLYPAVEEMQEILGNANDSYVTLGRLGVLRQKLQQTRPEDWKRFRFGLEAMLTFHGKRLPKERSLFHAWWERWQASGTEASLTSLLLSPELEQKPGTE